MPEAPRERRPRFKLTGLEGPEELLDRLRESNAELERAIAGNAELAAELDAVRRRLRGVASLTDDELAAELPRRMTRNLAAAQEVAEDIIERARNDAMIIRLNADQSVAQIIDGAKADAARIVRGTMAESKAQVAAARAEGIELLRAAHAQRSQVLADLEERSARAEHESQRIHDHRLRLEQTYEQVARALAEARAALADDSEASPATAPTAPTAPTMPPSVAGQRSERSQADRSRPQGSASADEQRRGKAIVAESRDTGRRPGAFDRSGAVASSRHSDVTPAPKRAFGRTSYTDADAAAG